MNTQSVSGEKENNEEQSVKINDLSEDVNVVMDAQEINETEHNIIKGDTVGDTIYSAKWILKTLISLSNVYECGWNESIENDLCTLWDMTAEKDIVDFLLENDLFKMAEFTLKISEEPRLTEIIVGIIGNMCCESKALDMLVNKDNLVTDILSLISSDDKETLIQVLRILQTVFWDIQKNPQSLWINKIKKCEILGEAICFILKSSINDELLVPTLDFVNLVSSIKLENSNNFIEEIFEPDQLIFAICEAMIELLNQTDNCHTEAQIKMIENWLNLMYNIIDQNLLKFSVSENDKNFEKINLVLLTILQPYEHLNNLILFEESCLFFIQKCIKMTFLFQKNEMMPCTKLIKVILKIMINLKTGTAENYVEEYEAPMQLYEYITNYWSETLKIINKEQITQIFQLCNNEFVNSLIEITNSIPKIPSKFIEELIEIKSTITYT